MKMLRKLLFPFSLLYAGITAMRNIFYDKGWLKSKKYNFPVICVGNLSTGGTGKTPMIELLVYLLKDNYNLAILSRGYKRKTSGFFEVHTASSAEEVGDEPLQFKKKFPEIPVAVCEDRQKGIELLHGKEDVILLDDAFQHRKVNASLNILLTSYDNLYYEDLVLPAGNLREPRRGVKRAQIIVVTKCPENLSLVEMGKLKKEINPEEYQSIFFSKIGYSSKICNEKESLPITYLKGKDVLLVTGIAKPKPFEVYVKSLGFHFRTKNFPDHHNFTSMEVEELEKNKVILTTEKDFMRLKPLVKLAEIYYLPIKTEILNNEEFCFLQAVLKEAKLTSN